MLSAIMLPVFASCQRAYAACSRNSACSVAVEVDAHGTFDQRGEIGRRAAVSMQSDANGVRIETGALSGLSAS
jgi:hypothetical protein